MTININKQQLRRVLREKRRALSSDEQISHAQGMLALFQKQKGWEKHEHIALYLAVDAEIDPQNMVDRLRASGKYCYLPVIPVDEPGPLLFAPWNCQSILLPNRYGILEPACDKNEMRQAEDLDMIILPLVGFDHKGNRLGMGGGFYDRTLEGKNQWKDAPMLIGLAYALQYVETELPCELWDICLDAAITEKTIFIF